MAQYGYCLDCGGVLERGGICGNCDEELHIMTYQNTGQEFSEEFAQKAAESSMKIAQRE